MKQTIDISPENVAPIASAGIRFLNMETTLIPGNIKQQLAVLEVFLGGLATGELMLATPALPAVESDGKEGDKQPDKEPDKDPDGPKTRPPTPEIKPKRPEIPQSGRTGAGEGQSG